MVSIRGIVRRTRKLWEPAPMRDFSDYDDYWHQRGEIRIVFGRWRLTAEALPDSGTLIDVGCGTGEFLTYLRDHRHSGLTMKGVDGSAESVRMTQQRGFDATVVNLLSGALPEKAEYLTCFEVLEHIPDAEVALRAMRDACQKRIFISVPNIGYVGCRVRLALFGRFPLTTCVMHIKEHVRFWTVRDFRQWAESNGLRLVRARHTRARTAVPAVGVAVLSDGLIRTRTNASVSVDTVARRDTPRCGNGNSTMPSLKRILHRLHNLWRPMPLSEFSDYDDYWSERGATNHIYRRWVLAADLLPEQGSVVDVGCGSGEFLTYLRKRHPQLTLSGVDISETSAEMTRAAGFDATAIDLLKERLPETVDCITCLEVIEHIPDAEIVVEKMRDACRDRLLISIPNVGYIGCRLRLLCFGRFPLTNCVFHVKEHVRFWTVRDFREWADRLGLRVVSYRGARGLGPMQRFWPSLFSSTMLYELQAKERPTGDHIVK